MIRTLVTGANGFLGSEVIRQAVNAGMTVRGTDLNDTPRLRGTDYYRADILYPDSLKPALKDIGCLVHIAGLAHIFSAREASVAPFGTVNETGTANVARAAAEAGVKHFVLISSVSVYGPLTIGVVDERAPCLPTGPYAESKYQAEQRAVEIAQEAGMSLTILRLATLYGKGDPGNIARLMKAIDRDRFFWIGDGSNRKSLLHKEDAARAILKVAQAEVNEVEIYNVSAAPCSMREIVQGLSEALGRGVPTWHAPASLVLNSARIAAKFGNSHSRLRTLYETLRKWLADDVYDTSRFETTFNFRSQVELYQGLKQEVDWYRESSNR